MKHPLKQIPRLRFSCFFPLIKFSLIIRMEFNPNLSGEKVIVDISHLHSLTSTSTNLGQGHVQHSMAHQYVFCSKVICIR